MDGAASHVAAGSDPGMNVSDLQGQDAHYGLGRC